MRLVLLKSQKVRGRQMLAGDRFECPDKEGKLWCQLSWAREDNDEEEVPRRNKYKRRDLRAEE